MQQFYTDSQGRPCSYDGPDESNPYLGPGYTPSTLEAFVSYTPVPSPLTQIAALIPHISDLSAYPGVFGDVFAFITNGAWSLAKLRLDGVTPAGEDVSIYNQIKSIVQAQIP